MSLTIDPRPELLKSEHPTAIVRRPQARPEGSPEGNPVPGERAWARWLLDTGEDTGPPCPGAATLTVAHGPLPLAAPPWPPALAPLALVAACPLLVLVPQGSPYLTLNQLAREARARPLHCNAGEAGSPEAAALAVWGEQLRCDFSALPGLGPVASLAALAAGDLGGGFAGLPRAWAALQAGRVQALAVTSAQPHPLLPGLPCCADAPAALPPLHAVRAVLAPSALGQGGSALAAAMDALHRPSTAARLGGVGWELLAPGVDQARSWWNTNPSGWLLEA